MDEKKILSIINKETETNLKIKALKFLREELKDAWIYHASDKWRKGIPDILIIYKGQTIAIELKVGNNKLTQIQKQTLKDIYLAGGESDIFYNMKDLKEYIKNIKKKH